MSDMVICTRAGDNEDCDTCPHGHPHKKFMRVSFDPGCEWEICGSVAGYKRVRCINTNTTNGKRIVERIGEGEK